MDFFSLIKRQPQKTQKKISSLEDTADCIIEQRGRQIQDGLNKATASTGTPIEKLYGGARRMAQISNIGGGSKKTGGGGFDEGIKALSQFTQAITVKKVQKLNGKIKLSRKKRNKKNAKRKYKEV